MNLHGQKDIKPKSIAHLKSKNLILSWKIKKNH